MDTIDALLIGRGTFETVLGFGDWPYTLPVMVASKTLVRLPDPLEEKPVTISAQPPTGLLADAQDQGFRHIYLDGGRLIQSFLAEGLVDDMIITQIPILIGAGIPLFGSLEQDVHLELIKTRSWSNGLVQSHYAVRA